MDATRVIGIAGILALGGLGFWHAYRSARRAGSERPAGDGPDSLAIVPADRPIIIDAPALDFGGEPFNFDLGAPDMTPETLNIPRTTRGLRNRNPGNIRWIAAPASRWRGMIRDDGTGYGVFDTDANGIRALAKQLIVYETRYKLTTVRTIITRWAPPSENQTGPYVVAVAKALRVNPDDTISARLHLTTMVLAIIKHENGLQPYNPEDVSTWSRLA